MIFKMMSLHKQLLVRTVQIGLRNISVSSVYRQKNLYETLGLRRDATQAEIKKAYFELSKLYHPDRISATDENLAKFREVSAAYEILGNEQSRRLYDKGLLEDFKKLEETEDKSDPIVNFYRKREVSKSFTKPVDDMEAWTQTYYAEIKKRQSKKHELYTGSKKHHEPEFVPSRYTLEMSIIVLLTVLFLTNIKDSKPRRFLEKVSGAFQ